MSGTEIVQLAGAFTGLVAALGAAIWVIRVLGRIHGTVKDLRDDWIGEPERPGVPARAGVMERLGRVERELQPNGGSSLRDVINRIEAKVETFDGRLSAVEASRQQPVQVNVNQTPPGPDR